MKWLVLILVFAAVVPCFAQKTVPAKKPLVDKLVAYDAKDKRYYSVVWAKAHGMKDKGGDHLIVLPKSKLPKSAKLSRAMKGVEP